MSYSWVPGAGMSHIGIRINTRLKDQRIHCPACGGHNFIMKTSGMYGKCFNCDFKADEPAYIAEYNKMTVEEARHWIEEKEGIDANAWKKNVGSERIVYKHVEEPSNDADASIKDDTYRAFLSELILCDKNKNDMRARCLCSDSQLAAWQYKTFPSMSEVNYFDLCRRLQRDGHILEGVPGFFKCKQGAGDFTFHQKTKGILMPLINHCNQIVGLQLRKDDDALVYIDDTGELEPKCSWFTSNGLPGGAKATAGVHYACDWKYSVTDKTYKPVFINGFCLTEGIMKADIIHYLLPSMPCIAVPGVSATTMLSRELERLKGWGVETIRLAFDMDAKTNEHVRIATEKVKQMIVDAGLKCEPTEWDVNITNNPDVTLKGFDDFLAYVKLNIIPRVKIKPITEKEEG